MAAASIYRQRIIAGIAVLLVLADGCIVFIGRVKIVFVNADLTDTPVGGFNFTKRPPLARGYC